MPTMSRLAANWFATNFPHRSPEDRERMWCELDEEWQAIIEALERMNERMDRLERR